jgi:glycosyltransferase involved in cell wall biosynthesis
VAEAVTHRRADRPGIGPPRSDRATWVIEVAHVVCSDRFAGVERYLTYVAPELAARGHRVTVIGGAPARMRADLGDQVRFVPAATAVDAARALARHRPHHGVVHAHMTDAEAVAVGLRPLTRCPVVATLHFAQRRGQPGLRRTVATTVARGIAAQLAISAFVGERSGVPGAIVLPNGVPDRFPGARDRRPVVLVAQRLEAEKHGDVAIRAWAESGLAASGWRLELAGEGHEAAALGALARQLDVARSVDVLGSVDDLPDRMASAGIFLASAPAEPFGLSVVEAMCASLPVVAAAGGAHRETVGLATPELLFPTGDATAAARLLRALADDAERRAAAGAAGRRVYEQRFTVEAHVDRLEQVYAQVRGAS